MAAMAKVVGDSVGALGIMECLAHERRRKSLAKAGTRRQRAKNMKQEGRTQRAQGSENPRQKRARDTNNNTRGQRVTVAKKDSRRQRAKDTHTYSWRGIWIGEASRPGPRRRRHPPAATRMASRNMVAAQNAHTPVAGHSGGGAAMRAPLIRKLSGWTESVMCACGSGQPPRRQPADGGCARFDTGNAHGGLVVAQVNGRAQVVAVLGLGRHSRHRVRAS